MKTNYAKHYLLGLLFIFSGITTFGQKTEFQTSFGGSGAENSYDMLRTLDGGYISVGYTTSFGSGQKDVYLVKTNGIGEIQWSKAYGDSLDEVGWAITQDNDSGYVITGTTNSFDTSNANALIFKTDKSGTILWTRTISSDSVEDGYNVLKSRFSNGFYVVGYLQNDSTGNDGFLMKMGTAGNVRWFKKFGSEGDEEAYGLAEDAQGNVIISGITTYDSITQGGSSGYPGNSDAFIAKFDSTGSYKWMRTYGDTGDDVGWDIAADKNEYLLLGWSETGAGDDDIILIRTDSNGIIKNQYGYGTPGEDKAFDIHVSSGSRYAISGYSNAFGGDRDVILLDIVANGNIQGHSFVGGTDRDGHWPTAVVSTRDGAFAALSTTRSFKGSSDDDMYFIKTDNAMIVNCNSKFEIITQGTPNLKSTTFGSATTGYRTNTPSLKTTSISSSFDTTLCCILSADVAQDSFKICEGTEISIGRSEITGLKYKWTDGNGSTVSSESNPKLAPSESTTYKLVVTSDNKACAADSSFVKVVVSKRIVFDFARDTSFCDLDSALITTRSNMASYSWLGKHVNSNSQQIKVKKADTVYFTGFDGNSCVYLDTMVVTVFSRPSFNIGVDTTICENTPLTMNGPANMVSYNWNNGEGSGQSFTTSKEQKHILVVVDTNGCTASDERLLFTNPFSSFSLGADAEFCEGGKFTIFGPGALGNYIWNDTSSSLQNLTVFEPGTYRLTAYNSFGCPYSDTIVLTTRNAPSIDLGPDFSLCIGSSRTLYGPENMKIYSWASGFNTDSLKVTTSGSYILTITDSFDCRAIDTVVVMDAQNPVITLGNDTTICIGDSLLLNPGSGFATYSWSTGSSSSSIYVKEKNTYTVTVIDGNGCSGNSSINVDTMTCMSGVYDLHLNDFTYYPVPAKESLYMDFHSTEADQLNIELVNMAGQVVLRHEFNTISGINNIVLPLSGAQAGIYFVRLNNSKGSSSFKIWIE